jgi:hypothetical protein
MDQPRVIIKAAKCQDIRKQTSIFLDGWFRVNWEPWTPGHFVIDKAKKIVTVSHDGVQFTISMSLPGLILLFHSSCFPISL